MSLITVTGEKLNSNMQEMGETREPMATDCWADAQRLANLYSNTLKHDFWVLYAAKPHATEPNTLVAGWEVIAKRPPQGMVGVMVFKWNHKKKTLEVDAQCSLPPDVPLYEQELSKNEKDFVGTVASAGKQSGAIVLS